MEAHLAQDVVVTARHPCGLVALNKPEGIRSHPNDEKADPRALLTLPYNHEREFFSAPDGERFFLLNRLDAPTSGIILLALDSELARMVKDAFENREVKKVYQALVKGVPPRPSELWKDRLRVHRQRGSVRAETGGNALAAAGMRLLKSARMQPPVSLIELQPKTGRTHQLRVQCAQRRLPIVGDATYGDFRFNRAFAATTGEKRLFLHASALSITFSWHGDSIRFSASAPLPQPFHTPFRH